MPAKYIKKPEITLSELRRIADECDDAGLHMEVICDYPKGPQLALRLHDTPNMYYLEDDDDDFPDRFWHLFVEIDLKTNRVSYDSRYMNYTVIIDDDISGIEHEDPYAIFKEYKEGKYA